MNPRSKLRVGPDILQTDRSLVTEECGNGRQPFMRGLRATEIDTQRSAVCRKFLNIKYLEPVTAGKPIDCHQRKIREVLMVDRVELVFRDKAINMRKLECDHTVRSE